MESMVIQIARIGGPEVMEWTRAQVGEPSAGQIRVKTAAAGLNFIDVYHRTGLYPVELPAVLGLEGAGEVEAIGEGAGDFQVGDRVGYCVAGLGAYAERRIIPADRAIKLPGDISFESAAAILLKGMTAEYLIRRLFAVKKGDAVLFHAVAGGVGLIACQWLKKIGATVIGTAGNEEKAQLAREHGCDYVILYRQENVADKVREITSGKGVAVAYDSVGRDTFDATLNSLAPRGMFVSYGNASGPVAPFDPGLLGQKGSLFFTRPTLMTYAASSADMRESANALFNAVRGGIKIKIGSRFALKDAADAHRNLESRKTVGSTLLIP